MVYIASVEESVKRILDTPLGSRVMVPEFGSKLYLLVDRRADSAWFLFFVSYVFEAVKRWETRIVLRRVVPSVDVGSGSVSVRLEYTEESSALQSMEVMLATA